MNSAGEGRCGLDHRPLFGDVRSLLYLNVSDVGGFLPHPGQFQVPHSRPDT
jgi:hypothetical protein